jgi:hypothetical protein
MTAAGTVRSDKDITPARNSNLKNMDKSGFFAGQTSRDSGILSPHRRGG